MSGLALAGWALATAAGSAAALLHARLAAREELVARACHELRTPLGAARLAVHLLCDERAATAVERELRRAGLALDDLCAAREGRRGGDRPELLDLGELLDETRATWAPVARREGRELWVDEASPIGLVRGDRLRLAQALGNLVGNALEHGAGPVRVRARRGADAVLVDVDDDGPGIPASVADMVARPRAGRGRRGRGLAIAAEIAHRHGGRLAAGPAPGGARLTLELPAVAPERPPVS